MGFRMNIGASAALQLRAILALMRRRMRTRYAGSRAGYVWAIVEALAWVFILKFAMHGSAVRPPAGTSFEVFFATGVIVARTWRSTVASILPTLTRRKGQQLPALHRLDAAYASWLLELATGGIVMISVLGILALFGFDATPWDLVTCVVAFAAAGVFSLAFALALAIILILAPGLEHFNRVFLMIMFLTSGFSFVADRMPPRLRELMSWNPLLHCIEWFRIGFYAGYESRTLSLEYLFTVTIACLFVGLAGERALRHHFTGVQA
jgi:capsular polysaccharide transport system permease protein